MPNTRRIKIVRVIARMNIGGPAIHVTLLNAGLDASRFESVLVSGEENPGEGNLLEWAATKGVRPIMMPEMVGEATFKPRDAIALRKMYALIRQEKPDLVHTHTAKAGFIGRLAAKLAGVPLILHTYHGHVLRGYYSLLKTRLLNGMEKSLAMITDRIIAISDTLAQELTDLGIAPHEKIAVVPLGLELDQFLEAERRRGAFRQEMRLPAETRLVGIVGRLAPIKNHRLFLETARELLSCAPNVRFVIVGDGLMRPELEAYARALGVDRQVIFAGWRRDLANIYADLDALVVSSINEGTPVSVIEALASGCPVVATRVGGLPDIVQEGKTGFLVDAGSARQLADALAGLLADAENAQGMGTRGREFVRQRFSSQRLIGDIETLYAQLLQQKGIV